MLATACFDGALDQLGSRAACGRDHFVSGQRYNGQYVLETQHGRGATFYPDGFRHLGCVYAGAAEFGGRATCPSGACYQGVFQRGQPHGAGQVTYPHGTQDVGVWCYGRLLRLLESVPASLTFDQLLTGHFVGWYRRRVLHVREPETALEQVLRSLEPEVSILSCSGRQLDWLTNLQLRDRRAAAFPAHRYSGMPRQVPLIKMEAWNDSSDLCLVQQHTFLAERDGKIDTDLTNMRVSDMLAEVVGPGWSRRARCKAALPAGRQERACRLLLHASAADRPHVVRLLLRTVRLSPDVMDNSGGTALILAAIRGHSACVDTLLDHGADVNHLTDEGTSALSLCVSLQHPDYSMRYHLDELTVFTYPDMTAEYADVVEWLGGETIPRAVEQPLFPTRPVIEPKAAKKKRTKSRKGAVESPPLLPPPPDIYMALVHPYREDENAEDLSAQSGQHHGGSVAREGIKSVPKVDSRQSRREPASEATLGKGSSVSAGVPSLASKTGEVTDNDDAVASEGESEVVTLEQMDEYQELTPRSHGETATGSLSSYAPTRSPYLQADNRDAQDSAAPGQAHEDTTPPTWSSLWLPEDTTPPPAPEPTGSEARSARTDIGFTTDWDGLSAATEVQHAWPSAEQLLMYAQSKENKQETAVRLIEAFCSEADGDLQHAQYTAPTPDTMDYMSMIKLLLRRGANPDISKVPYPAVHHALLAYDIPLLLALLAAGGDVNGKLARQLGGLAPLHISCALPGEESVHATRLLLSLGANPNVQADPNPALMDIQVLEKRRLVIPQPYGARMPIHVVCDRRPSSYSDKLISRALMDLLARAGADLQAVCNGHTPATLALRSGDLALAVDMMSRDASPIVELGPPHYDALALAVSPLMEELFNPDDRKQVVRTLIAYDCEVLREYPINWSDDATSAGGEGKPRSGNILHFATWVNHVDDNLLTCPKHELMPPQRMQKKTREAFLQWLAGLVADEIQRHEHMSPLINEGLYEEADIDAAEYSIASYITCEPAAVGDAEKTGTVGKEDVHTGTGGKAKRDIDTRRGSADTRGSRGKKTRLQQLLPAEAFCPLCDRVLGKCKKACPNHGKRLCRLSGSDLTAELGIDVDMLLGAVDDEAITADNTWKRKKRRAEMSASSDDEAASMLEVEALLDENGQPLECALCEKAIKRRKVVCSACKAVAYCSKQCRSRDWQGKHGRSCPGRSQLSLHRLASAASRRTAYTTDTAGSRRRSRSRTRSGRRKKRKRKSRGEKGERRADSDGEISGYSEDSDGEDDSTPRGRRGKSLDGKNKERTGRERRKTQSLEPGGGVGSHGLTPMRMPPGLAAFLAQFQGLTVGACRHLILGEWYEDDCTINQNYSFI